MTYDESIILAFLKFFEGEDIRDYIKEKELENHIKGYILCDMNKIELNRNCIVINEEFDFSLASAYHCDIETPLLANIIHYPIIEKDSTIVARTPVCTYSTHLTIQSGNFKGEMSFPVPLSCKKNMKIYFDVSKNNIEKIFCNDILYKF